MEICYTEVYSSLMPKQHQEFYAADMIVRCSSFDASNFGYPSGRRAHLHEWCGSFNSEAFGYLVDSAIDVIRNGSSVLADVTGIKLLAGSTFCFADGDVPAGLPPATLIARTNQMMFWQHFAQDATKHGVTINVIDSCRLDAAGGGGGLRSFYSSQRINDDF